MTFIISLILGCTIAGIVVGSQWAALKSVAFQSRADAYVQKDSVQLRVRKDDFLYTKTEKSPRPKQNSTS